MTGFCFDCAEEHGLPPTRNAFAGRPGRYECTGCGWGDFDIHGRRRKPSLLSRLLCRIGSHDWRNMDGHCAVPGCDARDDVFLEGREQT